MALDINKSILTQSSNISSAHRNDPNYVKVSLILKNHLHHFLIRYIMDLLLFLIQLLMVSSEIVK